VFANDPHNAPLRPDAAGGVVTPKEAAAMLGRLGGAAKSAAKTRAARKNGRKGGRPKKRTTPPAPKAT